MTHHEPGLGYSYAAGWEATACPDPAGFLMFGGGDAMTTDTLTDEQVAAVDDFLRLVAAVAAERHRDPMQALTDRLLDLRLAVAR